MATNTSPAPAIPSDAKTFIDGVLKGIGAPVNPQTEQGMIDWLANEQGGPSLSTFEANKGNPLGVQTPAAMAAGRAGNVQGGINATVANLLMGGNYSNLVATLRKGTSTTAIDSAVVASPWNGAHYGGVNTYTSTAGSKGNIPGLNATASAIINAATAGTGCSSKGNVFKTPGIFGFGSATFTYCELKALVGGLAIAAGGIVIVIGLASLIVGSLGGRSVGAKSIAPTVVVAKAAGRVAGAPRRRKQAAAKRVKPQGADTPPRPESAPASEEAS